MCNFKSASSTSGSHEFHKIQPHAVREFEILVGNSTILRRLRIRIDGRKDSTIAFHWTIPHWKNGGSRWGKMTSVALTTRGGFAETPRRHARSLFTHSETRRGVESNPIIFNCIPIDSHSASAVRRDFSLANLPVSTAKSSRHDELTVILCFEDEIMQQVAERCGCSRKASSRDAAKLRRVR